MSIGDAGLQEAMGREALVSEYGEAWVVLNEAKKTLEAAVVRLKASAEKCSRAEQVMIDDAVQVVLEARGNIAMLRDEMKR
jgi:hypothetical protein